MSTPLPAQVSLEQLKNLAKDLVKGSKAGDPGAAARIREYLPRHSRSSIETIIEMPITLSDAQLVIAREHGFPSWPKLKAHIEERGLDENRLREAFTKAVRDLDVERASEFLKRSAYVRANIDAPWLFFDAPPIVYAAGRGSREMVDLLLEYGADPNARSQWWAGGFGAIPHDNPELAGYMISRGARLTIHDAAALDRFDEVRRFIEADPASVNARGGDGQGPLHNARSVAVAEFLLDHGADIDMRDIDHGSTPAQYLAASQPEVCRYLLSRGARPDLFMAVQIGDLDLVERILKDDPSAVRLRVGEGELTSGDSGGGHIYLYTLKERSSPLRLAVVLGRSEIAEALYRYASAAEQLIAACIGADEARARALIRTNPGLVDAMIDDEAQAICDAAWSHQTGAVLLMLDLGFGKDTRGMHNATPLGLAALRGFVDIVDLMVSRGADILAKNEYGGVPLAASLWGALNFKDPEGDYPETARRLIDAGTPARFIGYPTGRKDVDAVLQRSLEKLAETDIDAAVKLGRADRLRALLERRSGEALLRPEYWAWAIEAGSADLVRLFLEFGLDPDRGEGDKTPLHQAAEKGSLEIVKMLLSAGADVDALTDDGAAAAGIAESNGYAEIAREIRNYRK